jgi:hypothetical protein
VGSGLPRIEEITLAELDSREKGNGKGIPVFVGAVLRD